MTENSSLHTDTICAISTPHGVGGIAVIRISGPEALTITDKIWHGKKLTDCATHTAHFGTIVDPDTNEVLDEAVATLFIAPASYTGENVVELSVHGSIYVQRELLSLLLRHGARMADPGNSPDAPSHPDGWIWLRPKLWPTSLRLTHARHIA